MILLQRKQIVLVNKEKNEDNIDAVKKNSKSHNNLHFNSKTKIARSNVPILFGIKKLHDKNENGRHNIFLFRDQ